jgi:hypothetical protein
MPKLTRRSDLHINSAAMLSDGKNNEAGLLLTSGHQILPGKPGYAPCDVLAELGI